MFIADANTKITYLNKYNHNRLAIYYLDNKS